MTGLHDCLLGRAATAFLAGIMSMGCSRFRWLGRALTAAPRAVLMHILRISNTLTVFCPTPTLIAGVFVAAVVHHGARSGSGACTLRCYCGCQEKELKKHTER